MDREEIAEKLKSRIDDANETIDKLEAEAEQSQDHLKSTYKEQINNVKEKRDAAAEKLESLQTKTELAWDDIKFGFEQALDSLNIAVKDASERFKKN